jgi:cell division ATPase FtsA
VLVCLARNAYLLPLMASLETAGMKVAAACPRSVALFSAFAVNATYTEDETSLLVYLGAQGIDLAIQRGGELLFARNATPGGHAFTQAIATAFSTPDSKAETLKVTKGDVTPRGQARYPDATSEKLANAMVATAGQVAQLIQSTLMIGRAQTKLPDLKIDRVLLAGGGASLRGLDAYLKQAMGVPVERFNPFSGCDLSGLPEDEKAALEAAPHEFAAALGLAQTLAEPAAFRLEVLPESVKKKRDLLTKGVFAIAAGLVAAVGLGLLWEGRKSASAEVSRQSARYASDERTYAQTPHKSFKEQLGRVQETREKHRLLAQMGLPGVAFSDAIAMLEESMKAHPEVFLEEASLEVVDVNPPFSRLKPKPGNSGGFETSSRPHHERTATVRVVGHVSDGPAPEKVYNEFVGSCNTNAPAHQLFVVPKGTFQAKDRKFELTIHPGILLHAKSDKNNPDEAVAQWMLRGPTVVVPEGGGEATSVTGTSVEGTAVVVQKDQVDPADWDLLVKRFPPASKGG